MPPINASPNNLINPFTYRLFSFFAALFCCFLVVFSEIGEGVNTAWGATVAVLPSSANARQNVDFDHTKPILLTPARAGAQIRTPHNEDAVTIILTLKARNIQVQADWSVTNAANNFAITNGTLSLVDVNKLGTLRATVYLADKFSDLNTAYTDLVSEIIITVAVGAQNANVYAAFLKAYFDSFMPAYGTYTETATGFDVFRTLFGTSVKRAEVSVSNSGYTIGEYAATYPSEVLPQIDFDINGYPDMQEFLEQSIKDHEEDFTLIGPVRSGSYIQFILNRGSIFVAENLSHLLSDKHGGSTTEFQTFKAALDHLL